MELLELGGEVGAVASTLPLSFATRIDLVSCWVPSLSRPHLARLCGAAVGVSCLVEGMPPYRIADGDPITYGGKVFDLLLSKGVAPGAIYKEGPNLLAKLAASLPQEEEVKEATDFTVAPAGA